MKRNNRRARRNNRAKQMTPAELRRFVMREAAKLSGELEPVEKVKAEEVEADEYADTLESDIDMYKAMKIKEARIRRQHRKMIREARKVRALKNKARKRILRKLK
tara:strand:- start:147 stop:461 length:315 start_codon:yes stop_codon:yes gene_type:complete